jgi:hypothetical protein
MHISQERGEMLLSLSFLLSTSLYLLRRMTLTPEATAFRNEKGKAIYALIVGSSYHDEAEKYAEITQLFSVCITSAYFGGKMARQCHQNMIYFV